MKKFNHSKITLKIHRLGYKDVFSRSKDFPKSSYPNEIYINGYLQYMVNNTYYLNQTINFVELIWYNNIIDCNDMFVRCWDIIEIDLSKFNSFQVNTMQWMFYQCTSLTSVNLSNFDTSQTTTINHMFYNCTSLISVDLSFFNTSKVLWMFEMFYNCILLTSLDLSNFNTLKVESMYGMFYGCTHLEYINLQNFDENNLKQSNNMFYNVPNNVVICINESNTKNKIFPQIKNKTCYYIDCSNNWKTKQKKIISETDECIDNCIQDSFNKYEYNGKCYSNCTYELIYNDKNVTNKCKCELEKCLICPSVALNKTLCTKCNHEYYPMYNDISNIGNYFNCYKDIKGYYLDKNDLLYKKCYYTCNTCEIKGNNKTHNCLTCNNSFPLNIIVNNYTNCFEKCIYYYYLNKDNYYHCTNNFSCPKDYPILSEDKMECKKLDINDIMKNIIKYEKNEKKRKQRQKK